jgi:hypothetical protein
MRPEIPTPGPAEKAEHHFGQGRLEEMYFHVGLQLAFSITLIVRSVFGPFLHFSLKL